MRRVLGLGVLLGSFLSAGVAAADLIPPAVEVCDGKVAGAPCSSEEGFGLEAFGGEQPKRFDGHCAPLEHPRTRTPMLICKAGPPSPELAAAFASASASASAPPAAPSATGEAAPATSPGAPTPPPPLTPSAPHEPPSRGCACRFVPARDLSGVGVAVALAALGLARRRRPDRE